MQKVVKEYCRLILVFLFSTVVILQIKKKKKIQETKGCKVDGLYERIKTCLKRVLQEVIGIDCQQ